MVLEGQVPFGRTAPGQDRRISGVEKLLHLLLLIRSGVDVAVSVDKPRHCAHAFCIDGLHTGNVGGAGRNRADPTAPNDDRTLIDHVTVTNDDPSGGENQILGHKISDTSEPPTENNHLKAKDSFHFTYVFSHKLRAAQNDFHKCQFMPFGATVISRRVTRLRTTLERSPAIRSERSSALG